MRVKISELVFIGIQGSVVALSRATGQQVWVTHLKGSDFANVVLDGERIVATAYGEAFCLEALTGKLLWHNGLKGLGRGLATIATVRTAQDASTAVQAEKRRRDEEAAAAAVIVAA